MKRRHAILLGLLLAVAGVAEGQRVSFGKYFTGGTLRIDCLREGSAEGDTVWVRRWVDRQAEWHGSRTQMIDPFDNGDYRVSVRDARSGREIYSRGYSNLFREYRATRMGQTERKRFEETLLVPMPKRAVKIALQRRGDDGQMEDATVLDFVPGVQAVDSVWREGDRMDLEVHGNPSKKVDVVIVAQGYGEEPPQKLSVDYYRMKEILFSQEPFAGHREDFNVYGIKGDVGAEFGAFGIDRYLMTFGVHRMHDLIGTTPCDFIIIMVNSTTYGGGAIYNFYAVSSLHRMADYVLPHEFGHAFGGLADEYVDEEIAYAGLHLSRREPVEPNITTLTDFDSKWKSMLPEGTAVPTPEDAGAPKTECGPLGVYEGAGYAPKGVYRPAMHCMMRDYAPFCPVCSRRLEEVFKLYTK
ncbi:MAG: hypothetical protein IJU19_00745 [Bacteroidales bacterium]|nr:hypothetical protein [Bacteroidales bacterium]